MIDLPGTRFRGPPSATNRSARSRYPTFRRFSSGRGQAQVWAEMTAEMMGCLHLVVYEQIRASRPQVRQRSRPPLGRPRSSAEPAVHPAPAVTGAITFPVPYGRRLTGRAAARACSAPLASPLGRCPGWAACEPCDGFRQLVRHPGFVLALGGDTFKERKRRRWCVRRCRRCAPSLESVRRSESI